MQFNDEDDSPSTPRARDFSQGYFGPSTDAQPSSSGPLTPKRNLINQAQQNQRQRQGGVPSPGVAPGAAFQLRLPSKKAEPIHHEGVEAHHPHTPQRPDDQESMYGEQGSEWGEDEENFEWLDRGNAPEAENGDGKSYSPSKKLGGRIKAAVAGHSEGKKLRKPLVFPRRAPPPPPPNTASAPPPSAITPTTSQFPHHGHHQQHQHQHQHHQSHTSYPHSTDAHPQPRPFPPPTTRPGDLAFPVPQRQRSLPTEGGNTSGPQRAKHRPNPLPLGDPVMVPMRSADGPNAGGLLTAGRDHRQSGVSTQSVAYSFYDLSEVGTPRTPRPPASPARAHSESLFPHGKYTKVSISQLEREREAKERSASTNSDPGHHNHHQGNQGSPDMSSASPDMWVAKGIEARTQGDFPKSAWFFMKASDAGSSTGRIYWGLALRHGWGVAKDEKRAFAELRQACDETLAQGGIDFHKLVGTDHLTLQQKKAITVGFPFLVELGRG